DIASPFELRRSPTTVRVTLGAWPRNSHAGARPRRRGDRMTRRPPARWHADKFSGGLNSRPATNCRRFNPYSKRRPIDGGELAAARPRGGGVDREREQRRHHLARDHRVTTDRLL